MNKKRRPHPVVRPCKTIEPRSRFYRSSPEVAEWGEGKFFPGKFQRNTFPPGGVIVDHVVVRPPIILAVFSPSQENHLVKIVRPFFFRWVSPDAVNGHFNLLLFSLCHVGKGQQPTLVAEDGSMAYQILKAWTFYYF